MFAATLHLKNEQSRQVRAPLGRALERMCYYMRFPASAADQTLQFEAPDGAAVDVPAGDVVSLEIPPPHALIRDFLDEVERVRVMGFMLAHVGNFQNSGVHEAPSANALAAPAYRIRRSRVIDDPANGVLAAMMMPKLQALMPGLWPQLGIAPLPVSRMECQITAHGDGDFFAVHTDNGTPEIAHRQVSYVYYFHRAPKQFGGGHLALFHTLIEGGKARCGRLAADIDPPANGLMIFPTYIFHEVTPISCASTALTDQRLTLNGWMF